MNEISKTAQSSGTKPRVVFFGNERIATAVTTSLPVLTMLNDNYDVVLIVASDTGTQSRNIRELEVETFAAEHNIPIVNPRRPQDIANDLRAMGAAIGVLVAYGKIIPQAVIDLFPCGIVNVHPSALPKHRGPTPIESVMLAGETETAVSVMQLAREMDAGPVYTSEAMAVDPAISKQDLAEALLARGASMLQEILPSILAGDIHPAPQNESIATYDEKISKAQAEIDLSESAVQLEREVRAHLGWPGSRTVIANKEVVITAAHIADNSLENVANKTIFVANKQLCLQTADGIFVVDSLKPAGKTNMPAASFLAGYGNKL